MEYLDLHLLNNKMKTSACPNRTCCKVPLRAEDAKAFLGPDVGA